MYKGNQFENETEIKNHKDSPRCMFISKILKIRESFDFLYFSVLFCFLKCIRL